MSKKFRLMSSTFLMALTLAVPLSSHGMETDGTELPKELRGCVVKQAAYAQCVEEKIPVTLNKTLGNLALVCKEWCTFTKDEMEVNKPSWKAWHGITSKYEDIYQQFLNGTLIYRPKPQSDEGMITLKISDLTNPLRGKFDLSQCGDTGKYLNIATGYRKAQAPENSNKVEIWLTPRFLIDKEMPRLAPDHHIRTTSKNWGIARAPFGIFWTWGAWNAGTNMAYCYYLTNKTLEELSSKNLFKQYQNSEGLRIGAGARWGRRGADSFTFSFVN